MIVSTLLVGLVAVGALRAVGGVFLTRASAGRAEEALALAQQLMSEVLQSRYEDEGATVLFGPESGEATTPNSRAGFDDVDDYHGWSSSPPRPKTSTTGLPGYDGWTHAAQVVLADPNSPLSDSATDAGLKRITVTVTDPQNRKTTLVAFRSRWGAVEQVPPAAQTVQTWVSSQLRIGGATPIHSGINLTNQAQGP